MDIDVTQYPQLRDLCWNRPGSTHLTGLEALALYERNWRLIDPVGLTPEERALIDHLVARYGHGILHV